jgi:glycerophosphoryl diester phosphodiesterase
MGTDVRCIAHRGFAGTYPENTLTAVRSAVGDGADAIEVDVRRCGSGDLVVMHDETVDRVTGRTGPVADYSAAELRALDVLHTGEGVPTLDAVLAALPGSMTVNVELKEAGLAAAVFSTAADHDADLLISSFYPDMLREAAEAGTAPLALLFADDPDTAFEVARRIDCRAVHPHWECCTEALVDRAHDAGFEVNAWTARSAGAAATVAGAGADGLISDSPDFC